MSGVPQGSLLGPALSDVFFCNIVSIIECTLSKFADHTKLFGAVRALEGRNPIQRDFDRLERGAHANLMKFKKARSKDLHLSQGNPEHKYRLARK